MWWTMEKFREPGSRPAILPGRRRGENGAKVRIRGNSPGTPNSCSISDSAEISGASTRGRLRCQADRST